MLVINTGLRLTLQKRGVKSVKGLIYKYGKYGLKGMRHKMQTSSAEKEVILKNL